MDSSINIQKKIDQIQGNISSKTTEISGLGLNQKSQADSYDSKIAELVSKKEETDQNDISFENIETSIEDMQNEKITTQNEIQTQIDDDNSELESLNSDLSIENANLTEAKASEEQAKEQAAQAKEQEEQEEQAAIPEGNAQGLSGISDKKLIFDDKEIVKNNNIEENICKTQSGINFEYSGNSEIGEISSKTFGDTSFYVNGSSTQNKDTKGQDVSLGMEYNKDFKAVGIKYSTSGEFYTENYSESNYIYNQLSTNSDLGLEIRPNNNTKISADFGVAAEMAFDEELPPDIDNIVYTPSIGFGISSSKQIGNLSLGGEASYSASVYGLKDELFTEENIQNTLKTTKKASISVSKTISETEREKVDLSANAGISRTEYRISPERDTQKLSMGLGFNYSLDNKISITSEIEAELIDDQLSEFNCSVSFKKRL